jgi:hypothetical protein
MAGQDRTRSRSRRRPGVLACSGAARALAAIVGTTLVLTGCGAATPAPAMTGPSPSPSPSVVPSAFPSPALDPAALADPGPYEVGDRVLELDVAGRDRPLRIRVYYPAAIKPGDPTEDAPVDRGGAPYRVVLGDSDLAPSLAAHLASHGLVYVEGIGQRTWGGSHPTPSMIDYPLDLMAALDGLAALEDDQLSGLLDTDRAGVVGYSFGSWTALMLAGARVDPAHIDATCATRPEGWADFWWAYVCGSPERWDAFFKRAAEVGVATDTGLWAPLGDGRIQAVVAMMPEGYDLTGPSGLASVTADTLFLAASGDIDSDYRFAAVPLFEHYPPGRGALVTFVGADHMLIGTEDGARQIRRLATLFLGARLLGEPAADLVTEAWVEDVAPTLEAHPSYETLTWGVVETP